MSINFSANATANSNEYHDVVCQQIVTDTVEIELNSPCESAYYIGECSPLYISVAAMKTTTGGGYRCVCK